MNAKVLLVILSITTILSLSLAVPELTAAQLPDLICSGTVTGGIYTNVIIEAGERCYLHDVTVNGDIHAEGSSSVGVMNSVIAGDIQIIRSINGIMVGIMDSTVSGDILIEETTSLLIGVTNNDVVGDVVIINNDITGYNLIGLNTIGGTLQCYGNNLSPIVGSNDVAGDNMCDG